MSDSLISVLKAIRPVSFREFLLCMGLSGLSGCHTWPEIVSAPVEGYNHTSVNINRLTVSGAGGQTLGRLREVANKFSAVPFLLNGIQV